MSGAIPPPSPGDIAIAAESLSWPPITFDGRMLDVEPAWRQAIKEASGTGADLLALWETLGGEGETAEDLDEGREE